MGGYVIVVHPKWLAMSLWDTLSGWLCHCGTPYVGGYVIVGHPIWVAMSLWDTLYRWLCHCGTPYIGGYVIVGHPVWVAMSLQDTLYRWLCHCRTPCVCLCHSAAACLLVITRWQMFYFVLCLSFISQIKII